MIVHVLVLDCLLRVLVDRGPLLLVGELLELHWVVLGESLQEPLVGVGHVLIGSILPDLALQLPRQIALLVLGPVFHQHVELSTKLLQAFILFYLAQVSHRLLESGLQVNVLLGVAGELGRVQFSWLVP